MYSGACPNFLTRAHARETEYKINSRCGAGTHARETEYKINSRCGAWTHARKKTFLSAL